MTDTTPRLSEVARHLVIPDGIVTSVFPRVQRRLAEVGVSFDRWQQGFGMTALGCRASGKYAASVGGVVASWPRQIGKTYTVGNMAIGLCLEFPGYRAIWTSHHNRTTTNTFRSMQGMVRAKRIWPHVAAIRTANGEQEIVFKNGSIIMFGAREQGFGRGMDRIDLEVFDEAQILGLKALEDMVPATNAAKHPHGGLVIFIGTPPRPVDDGEAFTAKREKALSGKSKDQFYCEISADPETDPEDESKFGTFNPSYPHRTPLEAMLRMIENIPDREARRREMLGIWPTGGHERVTTPAAWALLVDDGPAVDAAPVAFGVAAHDGQFSVVACWTDEDSEHVEEVFAHVRLDVVGGWLQRNARRADVLVPSYGPAAPLVQLLSAANVRARSASSGNVAAGCELLAAGIEAGTLSHSDQPQLADSLATAVKRYSRDGTAWSFDLKNSVQCAPAIAMTMALFGASSKRRRGSRSTTKRVRKAVIG